MDRLEERGSEHSGSGTSAGVWQTSRPPLEWVNQAALDRHFDRLALEERSRQAGLFEVHAVTSLADRVADMAGCRALNPKPACAGSSLEGFGGGGESTAVPMLVDSKAISGFSGMAARNTGISGMAGTPYYRPP